MKKNELIKSGSGIYRILHIQNDNVLVIDCVKMTKTETAQIVAKKILEEILPRFGAGYI